MERSPAGPDLCHEVPVAVMVAAHEGAAVLEHGAGRLPCVVKCVVALAQVVLDNADLRTEGGQGPAVAGVVHAEGTGQLLCHPDSLRVGGVHGGQPLAEEGNLSALLQGLHVCQELAVEQGLRLLAGRCIQ